jgi:hypothetical protein
MHPFLHAVPASSGAATPGTKCARIKNAPDEQAHFQLKHSLAFELSGAWMLPFVPVAPIERVAQFAGTVSMNDWRSESF